MTRRDPREVVRARCRASPCATCRSRAPPFGASGALDERERRVEVVHVHVGRHELVDHPRVVLLGRIGAELARSARSDAASSHGVPGMFADLDVVRVERGRGLEEQPRIRLGLAAALVVGSRNHSQQELELEVARGRCRRGAPSISASVRVSRTCSRSACQSPMPAEADARRLLAAVARGRTGSTRARRAPRPARTSSSRARPASVAVRPATERQTLPSGSGARSPWPTTSSSEPARRAACSPGG